MSDPPYAGAAGSGILHQAFADRSIWRRFFSIRRLAGRSRLREVHYVNSQGEPSREAYLAGLGSPAERQMVDVARGIARRVTARKGLKALTSKG